MKLIQVVEYEEISKDDTGEKFFKELEEFAQNNPSFISYSKSGKLKPQQYVGVIQTKSGMLEIYPKIAEVDKEESKIIFLKMLKTLKDHPFKDIHFSDLDIKKMPLLEIFIGMFLSEVGKIIKKGIKNDYILKRENQTFLKGKLLVSEHIRKNYIHKEKFYVEYDEYLPDIKVNRIIKSALIKLLKLSKNFKNQRLIREYLFVFDDVKECIDLSSRYILNRQINHYKTALLWAEVFLKNNTFISYSGKNKAFALLFDMNRLFESFVGEFFKRRCKNTKLQNKKFKLFENEEKFALIPDIVINENIIFDTKWKIINEKGDISQADLYQMYVYLTKYKAKRGYLIYPFTKNTKLYKFKTKICEKNAMIKIIYFDLKKEKIISL